MGEAVEPIAVAPSEGQVLLERLLTVRNRLAAADQVLGLSLDSIRGPGPGATRGTSNTGQGATETAFFPAAERLVQELDVLTGSIEELVRDLAKRF